MFVPSDLIDVMLPSMIKNSALYGQSIFRRFKTLGFDAVVTARWEVRHSRLDGRRLRMSDHQWWGVALEAPREKQSVRSEGGYGQLPAR